MKILFAIIAATILFTFYSLVHTLNNKIEAPNIEIMGLSSFKSGDDLGAALVARFWQEINEEKLVVFGSSKDVMGEESIVRGFLKASQKNNVLFDKIFEDQGLASVIDQEGLKRGEKSVPIDLELISQSVLSGQRVLVHLNLESVESQALMNGSQKGLAFLNVILPVTDFEKNRYSERCDGKTSHQLECGVLKFLLPDKSIRKKDKIKPELNLAMIEKISAEILDRRYYILFHAGVIY